MTRGYRPVDPPVQPDPPPRPDDGGWATYCANPEHIDSWHWGHWCYNRYRTKGPAPLTDGGIWGYLASATALIREFDLGDPDDETLVHEVSQAIAEAILDLGETLQEERQRARHEA